LPALHTQGKLSPEKQAHYAELNHKLDLGRKKAGDLQTAEVYFQKALELNPNYGEVYTKLFHIKIAYSGRARRSEVCRKEHLQGLLLSIPQEIKEIRLCNLNAF
jgi:Tfp pilus assembly protein PilF